MVQRDKISQYKKLFFVSRKAIDKHLI